MASPESPDKGAEGDGDRADAMGRFRQLTKGLLAVPLPELKEAERRYRLEREAVSNSRKPKPESLNVKPVV